MPPVVDGARFLMVPPSCEVAEQSLLPEFRSWFAATHGAPTLAQRFAWPAIQQGTHLLLSSPTGSGKTLAAFLPILSSLALDQKTTGLSCLYVSPLKALCRDACGNLRRSWRSVQQMGHFTDIDIRMGVRSGDTSRRVRQRHISDPPAILLTTPESLAQMLAHPDTQAVLGQLRWVVVDEVHAFAGSKRGADLAFSLERLADLCPDRPPQRIGLSATCAPIAEVGQFLAGAGQPCTIAQVHDLTEKQFIIEPLDETLAYSPDWIAMLLDRVEAEFAARRTTLIFTNTRRLAERLTWALRRRHPRRLEEIGVHHSSLSAVRRRLLERRLKQGRMWVVVSSSSLELGIDIGAVDSVVFVHPPGGVVRLLQRVGRSGHGPAQPRRGILLTATPGELLESAVTAANGRDGNIEAVRVIDQPLDVLCQHIVGMAMTGLWPKMRAYDLIRGAVPYRNLSWQDYQDCLDYLSGLPQWPARLRWEGDSFTIADARVAGLLRANLGTILGEDACAIRLRLPTAEDDLPRAQELGELDHVYAERLQPGDRFVLEGRCLEVKERQRAALLVDEVFGSPQLPRWTGAGVAMPVELARRIYLFRVQAAEALRDGDESFRQFLRQDLLLDDAAIAALGHYLLRQEAVSEVPALTSLLVERVSMQSCQEYFVHTPLPRSANEALARVLIQRRRQAGAAPMMAAAGDLGLYLLFTGPAPLHPDAWRSFWSKDGFEEDFHAHLRESNLLRDAFSSVAQTGLLVLRNTWGVASRRSAMHGRRLFDQLRAQAPDFVLLRQAEKEARAGVCDLATALAFAECLPAMTVRVRQLAEPSPLGESLLHIASRSATTTAYA